MLDRLVRQVLAPPDLPSNDYRSNETLNQINEISHD